MSLFDYPRINFKGTIQLNPGTANNDDYAGAALLPSSYGKYAGQTLALIDSKTVQPNTYGMSDEAFIEWAQKAQTFDMKGSPGQTRQIIPAEWNYYGGMDSQITAQVIAVQTGLGEIYSQPDSGVPLTELIGAAISFSGGHFTDVNSEGSPPATQFFIDGLTLANGSQTFINGAVSKGACQWLNFYRNVNLTADGGAGGYVYHVIKKNQPGTTINIPGFDDPKIVGVIFRYYLYRPMEVANSNDQIEALYQKQQTNPATLEIVGTFAPLYADENILTTPVGRLLVCNQTQIPTPAGTNNNGNNGMIELAPAVLTYNGNVVSADFVGAFPDYYQNGENPKYDFGEVSLVVYSGSSSAVIDAVDYANTDQGDQQGWLFDFDISANQAAQQVLQNADAQFKLVHASYGDVLSETDYFFVTNQQAIYTEQHGNGEQFLNQGATEPVTISVYQYGQELTAENCPPITIWQYRSIPLQSPGNAEAINTNFKPGDHIIVNTDQPGNFLFTFSIGDDANPPTSYSAFMNPPYITNAPSITLRILPNDEDFSHYYVDPTAKDPVGNDTLTFDVVYQKVLRTYYLLYPAMNQVFPLNSEQAVAKLAKAILQRTDPAIWMSSGYMPRTRDMSASRTQLLRAWCRKIISA